jgi:hypothetical protein
LNLGTDLVQFRRLFEDTDPMAGLKQADCCSQATQTITGNQNAPIVLTLPDSYGTSGVVCHRIFSDYQTTQRIGLPPASPGNHRPDGPKAGHVRTFKLDQSVGAGQDLCCGGK